MLDITGGMVVLREAGGAIMTADGMPVDETTRTLVAGPRTLCERFVELVQGYELEAWTADQAVAPSPDAGP
jgi:fructose-1,6-bisphosphatase/inositol monophosphatase family enzyme